MYDRSVVLRSKSGAKQDLYGKALASGFEKIVEPSTIVSVMLELGDGQIAFGDLPM